MILSNVIKKTLPFKQFTTLALMFLIQNTQLLAQLQPNIIYVSPKPKSVNNISSTDILLKFSTQMITDPQDIFVVSDQNNVNYKVNVKILDDGNTLLLHPMNLLATDIKITVTMKKNLLLKNNVSITPFSFYFFTTSKISNDFVNNEADAINYESSTQGISSSNDQNQTLASSKSIQKTVAYQVPISILASNPTNKGYYFISTFSFNNTLLNRCMIINEQGKIIYEKSSLGGKLDFKQLSNGTFSYFDYLENAFIIMDNTFTTIDTIKAGNGYLTDPHELLYDKRTGHYILLAQQNVVINMADTIPGGDPAAKVLGLIIQEIDSNRNVIFEWKTLDHLAITDAIGVNLLTKNIDYIHCNAIEIDNDTSLLLSSRHFNEIEKIDRRTGKLIWRFGLNAKQNMFTINEDSLGFSYQHDIRRLPNGHITLFDNGNFRPGARYSRALEYNLDEESLSANLVWKYRNIPDVKSDFMGSMRRLPNGNTLIGWGGTTPTFTEIDSANNKVMEITMPSNLLSYRAFKFDVDDIVKANQIKIPFKDTTVFCNKNKDSVNKNLSSFLIPSGIPDSSFEIFNSANNVYVWTQSYNNFFSASNTYLYYENSQLLQNDTILCEGNNFKLSVNNKCTDLRYKWSTADTLQSINIQPTQSGIYWVEMKNSDYYKIDSVNITISKVSDFSVLGQPILAVPFEILTYSVPYDASFNYKWSCNHGNIISGFNTNAVSVQWGNNDSNLVSAIISNKNGCTKQSSLSVVLAKKTGLNEMLLGATENKVFPNPMHDQLYIKIDGNFQYKLFDLTGRLMNFSIGQLQEETTINTNELNSGCYLLQLTSANKIEYVKVIKQ